MKTLAVGVFLFFFFILSIPLFLMETILGKINPHFKVKSSQAIVVAAFNFILFFCGIKKTVIGLENVPKDEPVLYVANHRSYFDILIGYTSVPTLTGFVAKKEISKVPFLRVWMRYLNCLFLDREDLRAGLKMVLDGVELVKKGYSIWISPEGTRNHGKEMLPFKEGSLKIAEKSGCAIVPVSLTKTDSLFETHSPWISGGHAIIEFGKPVYPKELDKEQRKFLGAHIQKIIQATLDKNESLV